MKINFYPLRQFDPAATGLAALGAAGPVGIGLSAAQTALGIVQAISGGNRAKRYLNRRRAYQTPEEIFEILKAQQSWAAEGYAPQTLNYLTGQVDRTSAASIDAAQRLGADPNQLSGIFDQAMQAKFRIGAENQLQNLKNFGGYMSALSLVADNKAAEQKSQQDLIKDQLQAASSQQQSGLQNIIGGANTALSTLSAAKTAELYNPSTPNATVPMLPPQLPNLRIPIAPNSTDISMQIGGRSTPNIPPVSSTGPTAEQVQQYLEMFDSIRKGGN